MLFDRYINDEALCEEPLSKRTRFVIELMKDFNHNDFLRTRLRDNQRGISEFDKPFKYPEHFKTQKLDMGNFRMELLEWKNSESNKVVLQLHGGGYVGMFKNYYRTMAGLYSEVGGGLSVLSIDYRVAPENPYPAALVDAVAAYEWLLDYGYSEEQIIIAGDSAGGGLALALCLYLKDKGKKLPSGLVLMSPWTDLTLSGASYRDNEKIDPIFGEGNSGLIFENPYAKDEVLENPYISPLFGNYKDFPPMLIQVGTNEMLYSDSLELAKRVKAAGVKVKYSEYQGMFHVFQAAATILPESKKAWAEIGRFIMLT